MNSACPICFETFEEKIRASPNVCNHIFCLTCLQTWAKTDNICPVDRKKFMKIINLDSETIVQVKPRKRRPQRVFYDVSRYCEFCKEASNGDTLMLCDCCDLGFHCKCLTPPLSVIPNSRWYCPDCVAVEERLRTNKATTADRILSVKYAQKRRKEKRTIRNRRTVVSTIHYHNQQRSPIFSESFENINDCIKVNLCPEKKNVSLFEQYDDRPGPSSSSFVREDTSFSFEEDDFHIGDSDFMSSDSSSVESELDQVINSFYQHEKISNAEMSGSEGSSYADEFQDYDFDCNFSSSTENDNEEGTSNHEEKSNNIDIEPFLPVFLEPCSSATAACENDQLDKEIFEDIDIKDSDFNSSSSENSESEVNPKLSKVSPPRKYRSTPDGCYLVSNENRHHKIDCMRKSEESLHVKHNNQTTNQLNPLSPEKEFKKNLKVDSQKIGSCNILPSEEKCDAKQKNPTLNDLNTKQCSIKTISKNLCFKIDSSIIESGGAKKKNTAINNLDTSFPTQYFMKTSKVDLNRKIDISSSEESNDAKLSNPAIKDMNTSSSKQSFSLESDLFKIENREIDCVIISPPEGSIDANQNSTTLNHLNTSPPKQSFMNCLKRARDIKRETKRLKISSSEESNVVKQNKPTTKDTNSSASKQCFMKSLKRNRDLNRKIDSPNQQVESETSEDPDPNVVLNSCSTEDIDSCHATSSESSETNAILIKLPLRLSFKRKTSKKQQHFNK